MKKLFAVLLFAVLAAVFPRPASAASSTVNFHWKVSFGTPTYGGLHNDTLWFASSDPAQTYYSTVYFPFTAPSGISMLIGPQGVSRTYAGPPYMYQAKGFQMSQGAGMNSFAGMRWNSYNCLPGPVVTMDTHPSPAVTVKNTTPTDLHLTNGRRWVTLKPGEQQVFPQKVLMSGEITLYSVPEAYSWNECASVFFHPDMLR